MRIGPQIWILLPLVIALLGCGQSPKDEHSSLSSRARELARKLVIVDTHIDVPYRLQEEMRDIGSPAGALDFDYPRARQGGLDLPFMSIYIPASYQETGGAKDLADELITMMERVTEQHPDKFALVQSVEQARTAASAGRIGLALGMENGAPIEGSLDNLRHFYDRGIRYITLTHSENNHICDSSYATEREWNGLSPFGRELVAEMNRLGVMVDVSHVSDAAFEQTVELSRAPVIASHSSCRRFTPDWERNMSDAMIRKLAERGGVIQINFGSAFLTEAAQAQSARYWKEFADFLEQQGVERDHPEAVEFREDYWKRHERIYADVSDVADHIDHVVALTGIDHVGFGSDFDGVGDSLPAGLKDVSAYPNLIRELLERGYTDEEIEKICSGNLFRVWSEVERIARELQDRS